MRKEELKENFKALMGAAGPLEEIQSLFYKAIESEVLDVETIPDSDYMTAKIIWHAILLKMTDEWAVTSKGNTRKVNELFRYFQKETGS